MNKVVFLIFKIACCVLNDILVPVFTEWTETSLLWSLYLIGGDKQNSQSKSISYVSMRKGMDLPKDDEIDRGYNFSKKIRDIVIVQDS